ncbi:MAG: M24 family metallopeptidase [Armatimonadetes bacterium]|nr:M24 family metallopeptidase [Armatimonadota bacterium]
MAEITCNLKVIHNVTGLDVRNSMLYPHMDLDSTECSSPVMVRARDGKAYLLVKDIERGNFDEKDLAAEVLYFKPYVTFDRDVTPLPSDWIELIDRFVDEDTLVYDDFYTLGYWKISDRYNVKLKATGKWDRTYVYSVDRQQVLDRFASGYGIAQEEARRLVRGLSQEKELSGLLENTPGDSRFAGLDSILRELGAGALLLSSPLNVQEVAAIPYHYLEANETLALYSPDEKIYIFSRKAISLPYLSLEAIYPSLALAAARTLRAGGPMGFEENHLPYKYFTTFGLSREKTVKMSVPLRTWREARAVEELPFYIIAAQVTRHGMEQAIAKAGADIAEGRDLTESKVQKYLYHAYGDFQKNNRLQEEICPYFVVLHAGHRTRKPNLPSFISLRKETQTLKIDCGVLVIDGRGLIRGASDLCRTLNLGKAAQEFYGFIDQVLVNKAIPAVRPGRTGEQVYKDGVRDLVDREKDWVEMGLLPEGYGLANNYNRNIGHAMGKQEPAALCFEKGNDFVVREGMVCCLEYQWPYYPYAIGVEDMIVVTVEGPVNITR